MASYDEAKESVYTGVEHLAKKAVEASDSSRALKYAAAANQLAEALAWLSSPHQPHGGGSKVADS